MSSTGASCRACGGRRVRPLFDSEHGLRFYCPDCGRYRGPKVGDKFEAQVTVHNAGQAGVRLSDITFRQSGGEG